MRRTPITSYLGPALVLYLIAAVAASGDGLAPLAIFAAAVAALLSLSQFAARRNGLVRGARRVGWLGLALAVGLVAALDPRGRSLAMEAARVLSVTLCGALLIDLALRVPDRILGVAASRALVSTVYGVAAVAAAVGLLAVGPVLQLGGFTLLLPASLASQPDAWLAFALALALAARLLRRRSGSGPEALASNSWAVAGLLPAVMWSALRAATGLLPLTLPHGLLLGGSALVAALLLFTHLRLVDPEQRLRVGPATRSAVAAVLAVALPASAITLLAAGIPSQPLALAATTAALLVLSAGLHRALLPLVHAAFAPASGRLLDALARARELLGESHLMQDVARLVLGASREAAGTQDCEPLLYTFDPASVTRIDAAGQPHPQQRTLHPAILERLRERPGELILREPLEKEIVRSPPLRPLIEALIDLDALCVVPLTLDGELEGAWLLPRGRRRGALTLEEIEAVRRFARYCASFVGMLAAQARAERRITDMHAERVQAESGAQQARQSVDELRAQLRGLVDGPTAAAAESRAPIAYSDAMREVLHVCDAWQSQAGPFLLHAESGVAVDGPVRRIHGGDVGRPFVRADLGALPVDSYEAALFGIDQPDGAPGWLDLAQGGTLLLLDLPALPVELQRRLGHWLSSLPARNVRLAATSRQSLDALVAAGQLDPQLAQRLSASVLHVPPLRQRRHDLPSLILLALDRACRTSGRPSMGITEQARQSLAAHGWPGNERELQAVLDGSVARAQGARVELADLPAWLTGLAQPGDEPLDGTLETVEKRVLRHALDRAHGNKSEAARLLGLKRTTFLDKLRRHKLDGGGARSRSSAPPN